MTAARRSAMRILVSVRHSGGTLNARLAALAAECVQTNGGTAELASMRDGTCPCSTAILKRPKGYPRARSGSVTASNR